MGNRFHKLYWNSGRLKFQTRLIEQWGSLKCCPNAKDMSDEAMAHVSVQREEKQIDL